MDRTLDRLREGEGISSHPSMDDHVGRIDLVQRQIHEWRRLFVQSVHFAVVRHTDYCEPFVGQVRIELLAEALLIRPVAIHK